MKITKKAIISLIPLILLSLTTTHQAFAEIDVRGLSCNMANRTEFILEFSDDSDNSIISKQYFPLVEENGDILTQFQAVQASKVSRNDIKWVGMNESGGYSDYSSLFLDEKPVQANELPFFVLVYALDRTPVAFIDRGVISIFDGYELSYDEDGTFHDLALGEKFRFWYNTVTGIGALYIRSEAKGAVKVIDVKSCELDYL